MCQLATPTLHRPRTLALALSVLACLAAPAQTPPAPATPATQASQPAVAPLTFDIVSIRRNTSGSRQMIRQSSADTDEITMTNVPLALVVYYAYNINNENLVSGLPDWAWSERYDVTAKVAPSDLATYRSLANQQRAAMLQTVLADRCHLQVHRDSKDLPVYALIVGNGGARLKQAPPNDSTAVTPKPSPNGFSHGATISATGPGELNGNAATMADLALTLSNIESKSLGRLVVDRTGLTGKYNFTLQTEPLPPAASDGEGTQQDAAASLIVALQQQLGLKLQPETAPTTYLVIDHMERPSPN
jgi:uncharacterized protein (TIGR03435 family)